MNTIEKEQRIRQRLGEYLNARIELRGAIDKVTATEQKVIGELINADELVNAGLHGCLRINYGKVAFHLNAEHS